MLDPKVGDQFEFTMEGGQVLTLEYKGRAHTGRAIWYEADTGATLDPLPPYMSFKQIK